MIKVAMNLLLSSRKWFFLLLIAYSSIGPISCNRNKTSKGEHARSKLYPKNGLCGKLCCSETDEDCWVPFMDIKCHCDLPCLYRIPPDCCDDIFTSCRRQLLEQTAAAKKRPWGVGGRKKPETIPNNCFHEGVRYNRGAKIQVGCNKCTCVHARLRHEFNWKCTQRRCLINTVIVDRVNHGAFGWRAENYTFLNTMSLREGLRHMTGTNEPLDGVMKMTPISERMARRLPEEFDARTKWGHLISPVLDQGQCASSWAFSTASVASDRLSIHSHGQIRPNLSPQHLLSCNSKGQDGCHGGNLDRAWWYLRKYGLVDAHCYPYHSGNTGRKGKCMVERSRRRRYNITCPLRQDKRDHTFKTTPPYRIASDEEQIMKEIMEYGPVQALIEVHEDLFLYKTGVYKPCLEELNNRKKKKKQLRQFHSVKLIGWGSANETTGPVKYWLAANSWGPNWGEDGYFRIIKGDNVCRIESFILAVWGRKHRPTSRRRGRRTHRLRPRNRLSPLSFS